MRKKQPKKFKKTKHKIVSDLDRSVNPAQRAVLDTLRYRQIFDCPMSYHQIWNYLISNKPVEEKNFKCSLSDLIKDKKIICKDGWYSTDKVDYEKVELRKKQAKKLMTRAGHIVKYLKQIPWIEMVAVTGSVAAVNADEQSDIDILVVTKPKRLWLTRMFLVSILKILGVYWNAQKPAGTICPNILTTADNLTWHGGGQNLYTANEISLLCPLFFCHNCYFDFLHQNSWVSRYLPNFHHPSVIGRDENSSVIARSEATKQSHPNFHRHPNLVDLIELIAMKIQMFYMKNKKTTEVVSKNFVHFNTHDSSAVILKKFDQGQK